jgi:uncharacterized protein (DUF1015 family)
VNGSAVTPFRALRYQAGAVGDPGAVWAPPYDVITPEDAAALRRKSPFNIVRVTNPEGAAPERYAEAARTLRSWVSDGIMARAEQPAVYVHRHRFEHAGAVRVRTGLWALLELHPFEAGVVLPHERTMKGPKADRLALMRACHAHLSPVFFICSDPGGRLGKVLARAASGEPSERTEFPAGQAHEVWSVGDPAEQRELVAQLEDQVFLIADGHHRYETALALRDTLKAEGARPGGGGAPEHLLAYIVPDSDPGLLLLPTHRTVAGEPLDWVGAALKATEHFQIARFDDEKREDAMLELEREAGRPTFMVVAAGQSGGWLMRLRKPDSHTVISSVALHEIFMTECLGLTAEEQVARTGYVKDPLETLEAVESGSAQAAILLAPTDVAQVRTAAAAGKRTPPKTTYFWPKVPTGVAVHSWYPEEV